MTYKLVKQSLTGREDVIVRRKADNASIPFDPDNRDYQDYLEWLKVDGNVPEAADEWD